MQKLQLPSNFKAKKHSVNGLPDNISTMIAGKYFIYLQKISKEICKNEFLCSFSLTAKFIGSCDYE